MPTGTLLPVGKLENIQQSLDSYLSNFASAFSVHLHGVRKFNPPISAPWLEAHYNLLSLTRDFRRQSNATEFTVEITGTIDLLLKQFAQTWTTRYTLQSSRDTLIGAFPEGQLIPVLDFSAGQTQVGGMLIDGISERLLDDGHSTGVIQHSMSVNVRYFERYTVSS